jgi:TnpA family transposase
MLPRVDIGEVILEVISWHPRFVEAFTAASGGETRLADLDVTIAAALMAHALNIGYTPVISPGVPALTRARISHVDQHYLRADTYAAANAPLIEAQAEIALARALGGGLVAGVDGIRFVVPVPSIYARPNPKSFGRRRGATWLNLLLDQSVGLASKVVSGTPRDSLHIVDLIYRQDGGRRPEVIVSDTGSYSDITFGLLQLLGFAYRPEFADLPDSKLWRIDAAADYGALNAAARGRIDLERIRQHYPDMLRLVASIHTGAVSAHDVIRMLSSAGKMTQLGEAIAHYGRIFKTLHVLLYVRRDLPPPDQRDPQPPGRPPRPRPPRLPRRQGELRQRYHEGMEDGFRLPFWSEEAAHHGPRLDRALARYARYEAARPAGFPAAAVAAFVRFLAHHTPRQDGPEHGMVYDVQCFNELTKQMSAYAHYTRGGHLQLAAARARRRDRARQLAEQLNSQLRLRFRTGDDASGGRLRLASELLDSDYPAHRAAGKAMYAAAKRAERWGLEMPPGRWTAS